MARASLRAALLVAAALAVMPAAPAYATYPVFDTIQNSNVVKALKEAKDQLKAALEQVKLLKDQLSFLNDITGFLNEVSDAIGEIASIDIPLPDLIQAVSQVKSDMACLMPDGPMWGIRLTDLNLSSICETSSRYRAALFIDEKKLAGQPFSKTEEAWQTVSVRRDALLEDTAVRSLAQGDVQLANSEKLNKTAEKLQAQLKKAKTLQEREHIQAQIQLLQVQASIAQNQIAAQQLKLQGIAEIKKGLPPKTVKDTTGVEAEE